MASVRLWPANANSVSAPTVLELPTDVRVVEEGGGSMTVSWYHWAG
jgi:hypothetical protein